MSFVIRSIVQNCSPQKLTTPFKASDRITLAADALVATTLIVISGLILGGVLNTQLLTGVGTLGHHLAIGGAALGGGLFVADLVAGVIRFNKGLPNYTQSILDTPQVVHSLDEIRASRSVISSILGELYLSDCLGFAGTTNLTCKTHTTKGVPYDLDTTNAHGFQTVITACCVHSMAGDFELKGDSRAVRDSYQARGITWLYVGKSIADDPSAWKALVHDCTFPESLLSQLEITGKGMSNQELDDSYECKTTVMNAAPPSLWFSPIFAAMDEAVRGNKRVLVHCQAGVSRSASLIAAYLINRFQVTTDQAINFLKSRRACVEPKFVDQLRTYEGLLRGHPTIIVTASSERRA